MTDMSGVIIPRSDQVNADDFVSGPRTYTIEGVAISAGTEQPVSISLIGEKRVWRPCKSMSRVLVAMWGPDAKAYAGRSLTLYRDPDVTWAGMKVGGIRISHMSHIERDHTMALTVTKQSRKPFTVKPLAKPNTRAPDTPPASERPAESASAPTEPEAPTPAGEQSGFDGELNSAMAKEWTKAALDARLKEIKAAFDDHGGELSNLNGSAKLTKDEVATMPDWAQDKVRDYYADAREVIEAAQ